MDQFSFKAFLSHRYKSPEVNLYFFNIFKEVAEVQFEVDEGEFSTNVTRLESMILNSDAFIGIYPFPGTFEQGTSLADLKDKSKYFRLELDLAIRSGKPAIIFYDQRYRNLLYPPEGVFFQTFDINEVNGTGGYPGQGKQQNEFSGFVDAVRKRVIYDASLREKEKTIIPIMLSVNNFNEKLLDGLKEILLQKNFENVVIVKPPVILNMDLFRVLEKTVFAIVDHSGEVAGSGLPAYLHGRFIPMIRIEKSDSTGSDPEPALNSFLYNGVEVGYNKDLIKWSDDASLIESVKSRLESITAKVKRINTYEEAIEHFKKASLRNEMVFVSYCGKDADMAIEIIQGLKNSYQTVFDYRDGESIVAGRPWLDEIFHKLSKSAIGINLLSASYLDSGNCMHEAMQMVANFDSRKIKLIPVKLYDENLQLPEFFESLQYLRRSQFSTTAALVKRIIDLAKT